jgi:hypothetical protein
VNQNNIVAATPEFFNTIHPTEPITISLPEGGFVISDRSFAGQPVLLEHAQTSPALTAGAR